MDFINNIINIKNSNKIIEYIDSLSYNDINILIYELDKKYFEGNTIIDDYLYDIIRNFINNKFPNSNICNKIGYVPEDNVKLKYYMGSENKTYKSDGKLLKWKEKYGTDILLVSAKADGVSILWDLEENKLFSRGNGIFGKDITTYIKYFNYSDENCGNIFKHLKCIRGELVIKKPYTRNIVAGQLNKVVIDNNIVNNMFFVAYEIIKPRLCTLDQFELLSKLGIRTVSYMKIDINNLSYDILNNIYTNMSECLNYDIDGLIIRNNNINELIETGNPPWSICYKVDDKLYITTIIDIKWNISKKNIYIPIAILEPIKINNSTISKVYCYNFKYVMENRLGKGAIIELVKKGGVIPKINKVIKSVKYNENELPYGKIIGPNIVLIGPNKLSDIKRIINFFKQLGFKKINKNIIEELYNLGYVTVLELLSNNINVPQLVKKKSYIKVLHALHEIKNNNIYTIPTILSALSLNNILYKRACLIYNHFPNLLNNNTINDYTIIDGINKKLSDKINKEINDNFEYINNCLNYLKYYA